MFFHFEGFSRHFHHETYWVVKAYMMRNTNIFDILIKVNSFPLSHSQICILDGPYFHCCFDEDINTIITPTGPAAIHTGPITRARARQLNYQVLSFLGIDSNIHENMMLPKLDTFVLLTNEGPSFEKDEHWSKNKHGDDGMRMGNKNGVTSDDFRTLKPP